MGRGRPIRPLVGVSRPALRAGGLVAGTVNSYREPDVPRDPVPVRLREELHLRRAAGESFEAAWLSALDVAVSTVGRPERQQWEKALEHTRKRWKAAYNYEPPTRNDRALTFCAMDRDVHLPAGRACELCGAVVTSKYSLALFCSHTCSTKSTAWRKVAA